MNQHIRLNLREAGCPFCRTHPNRNALFRLRYSETLRPSPEVEDFEGWVEECIQCGIYIINPRYDETEFEKIYNHLSRKGKGSTTVKSLAGHPLRFAMVGWHSPNSLRRIAARLIGKVLDPVLHIPITSVPMRGKNVLDVGCGDGFHLRCYGKLGCALYGTEIHSGYIPFLEKGPETIRYWVEEFSKIDWEKETGWGTFDLILFQSVFYRLNNPREALDLSWRLLKPGGAILRIEPFFPNIDAAKFMTRFNFPQGYCYISNIEQYCNKLSEIIPGAQFSWDIIYGRSRKMATGKELTLWTAALDIIERLSKNMIGSEPWYIRLEIKKPK